MREVIDLFADEGSVDELGIGSIRDAFSDLLFPGLSTIQTRARYFLLIPWVYLRIERDRTPSARVAERARGLLTDLVYSLERGGAMPNEGIIGWYSRRTVQRLPTDLYWSGLKTFGIRLFTGSISEYHRSLDGHYRRLHEFSRGEGDESIDIPASNWTSYVPPTPGGLWEATTIELTRPEADFLTQQVSLYCRDSMLAHYLQNPTGAIDAIGSPWDHPAATTARPETLSWLDHAHLFSDVMHGAALAYNLMVAERAAEVGLSVGERDLIDLYRTRLDEWASELDLPATRQRLVEWDTAELWTIVAAANNRIPAAARTFASTWIESAQQDPYQLAGLEPKTRRLISDRELRLKKGKARLHNHRALEMWNGYSGVGRLNYRWPVARTFIADVQKGRADA